MVCEYLWWTVSWRVVYCGYKCLKKMLSWKIGVQKKAPNSKGHHVSICGMPAEVFSSQTIILQYVKSFSMKFLDKPTCSFERGSRCVKCLLFVCNWINLKDISLKQLIFDLILLCRALLWDLCPSLGGLYAAWLLSSYMEPYTRLMYVLHTNFLSNYQSTEKATG